jgi:hypothetical protein
MPRIVQIIEQAGDPTAVANSAIIYAKDVGGVTKMYILDSAGSLAQLGPGVLINYTFKPGAGATGPSIFSTWSDLYSALDATRTAQGGRFTIIMDSSSGAITIPSGSWNMQGVDWESSKGPNLFQSTTVTVADGAVITNLMGLSGLTIAKENVAGTAPIQLGAQMLTIVGCTLRGGGSANTHLIKVTNAGLVTLRCLDYVIFSNTNNRVITVDTGGTVAILADGGPVQVQSDVLEGLGGASIIVNNPSMAFAKSQPNISGTVDINQNLPTWFWLDGDPDGLVQASLGSSLIDSSIGETYVNIDGAYAWAPGEVPIARNALYYREDFEATNTVSHSFTAGGGNGSISSESGRPGIHLQSVTAVADAATWLIATSQTLAVNIGGGKIRFRTSVRRPVIEDGTDRWAYRVGFGANTLADIDNGIYFEADLNTHGTTNWRGCAANGGTRTKTDLSVAPGNNTWDILEFVVNAAGTSVDFWVNGIVRATVSTNLPSTGTSLGVIETTIKTLGSTIRNQHNDYFELRQWFSTPR